MSRSSHKCTWPGADAAHVDERGGDGMWPAALAKALKAGVHVAHGYILHKCLQEPAAVSV